MEEAALSKEKDKVSQERLDDVRKEVAALQDELQPLLSRYNKERARLQELRRLRKKREDLQVRSAAKRQLSCWRALSACLQHSKRTAGSSNVVAHNLHISRLCSGLRRSLMTADLDCMVSVIMTDVSTPTLPTGLPQRAGLGDL